jgi:hypothetical protein
MNDTSPEIAAIVREQLLSRSGVERVVMGSRMFDVARTITLASFPSGLSEIETKVRLCERLYGNEVDVEAYLEHLIQSKAVQNTTQLTKQSR